jgi:ubiquinone/menaquinone biosynthesis C-methylase UbiE
LILSESVYDQIGAGYAARRQPDPRIAAAILEAIGDAHRILNVGAGSGSYEPRDREVLAVEPSATMIEQRPPGSAPCLRGTAEALPAEDKSFDCAMAILTIHHWSDWRRGLDEMRRVADRAVILSFEPDFPDFWLTRDYLPEARELDRRTCPSPAEIVHHFGTGEIEVLPIPHDCIDGFHGAYWRRPEQYLDPEVRRSISTFARIPNSAAALERLAADLENGAWHRRNTALLALTSCDVGYRLIRADFSQQRAT